MGTMLLDPTALADVQDAYCTPRALAERLGYMDTDPCSNPRSWIVAGWSYSLEKGLDGLRLPWYGRTFTNWPYSSPMAWAEKGQAELRAGRCTEWIILCKLDSSTRWWAEATRPALACLDRWEFPRRLQFEPHPALIAHRQALRELALIARAEALTVGRTPPPVPPVKPSSDFASVILHHRAAHTPPLALEDLAVRWRRG